MGTVLEGHNYSPTYHVLDNKLPFEPGRTNFDRLKLTIPESANWIKDYKKTPGSIFKYYSVKNEFDFLKSAKELTSEKQEYYIQENVKRYLGEFVGQIPYTTIHYEMDRNGFMFAGMHVMDSYKKAAEITKQSRENAEAIGFQTIQDSLLGLPHNSTHPTSAYWISPPKDWDYGFVFVLKKDDAQHITEYILRYPEKRGEFTKSNELLTMLDPNMHELHDSDDFLLVPQFGKEKGNSTSDLDMIMRTIGGTSEKKIAESHYFEEQTEKVLGTWISEYAKRIVNLSKKDKSDIDYEWHIEQAEILLLSIYQQAQDIIRLHPFQQVSPMFEHTLEVGVNTFSQERFDMHRLELQTQKALPQTTGGSCPVVGDEQNILDPARFISNNTLMNALKNGLKLEGLTLEKSNNEKTLHCVCPFCQSEVDAKIANGKITCPRKVCGKSAPYKC